jgi:hypothetical protein
MNKKKTARCSANKCVAQQAQMDAAKPAVFPNAIQYN